MNSALEGDQNAIDLGNFVMDAMNNGLGMFTPEMFMQALVQNYQQAKKLYGETIIREVTGDESDYVERNLSIPEYKRQLEEQVKHNIDGLKDKGLLSKKGNLTEDALELAALVTVIEELEHLKAKGELGERVHKRAAQAGAKDDTKRYKNEPYRDINFKQSLKTAIRRSHKKLRKEDLRVHERSSKGYANLIYALDVSGSMKGDKLAYAKKAGVALAYKAINEGDKVGLVVFGKEVKDSMPPGKEFFELLKHIVRLKASSNTDIAKSIEHATRLFDTSDQINHLILLTDALPTVGEKPESRVLEACAEAAASNVTISVVGIGLDKKGEKLASKMVELGNGRLLQAKELENLDVLILEEYERTKH